MGDDLIEVFEEDHIDIVALFPSDFDSNNCLIFSGTSHTTISLSLSLRNSGVELLLWRIGMSRTRFDFCNLGFSIILFEEEMVPSVWECRKGDGWRGIFFPFYMHSVWIRAIQTTCGIDPLSQADQTQIVCCSIWLLWGLTTGPCFPKQISMGWVRVSSSKTQATLLDHDINGLKVVFHNSLSILLLSLFPLTISLLFADLYSSSIFALQPQYCKLVFASIYQVQSFFIIS